MIGVALFGSLIATGPFAHGFRIALGISVLLLGTASLTARGVARPVHDRQPAHDREPTRD